MLNFLLNILLKMILGKTKDVAVMAVSNLESVDLTNSEKRSEAFKLISTRAKIEGQDLKSSLINLAIEVALQLIRRK